MGLINFFKTYKVIPVANKVKNKVNSATEMDENVACFPNKIINSKPINGM
jgi:hypothetical protein